MLSKTVVPILWSSKRPISLYFERSDACGGARFSYYRHFQTTVYRELPILYKSPFGAGRAVHPAFVIHMHYITQANDGESTMPSNALVQTRALPLELISNSSAYDAWCRAKVQQALDDTRPDIDDADAEAHFADRRSAALRKAATGQ